MTISMIPLSNIKPKKDNPRKSFDEKTIEGLALSIKTDGLLQNLVVAKPQGRKKTYHIISGERRYRAMSLLIEREDLPKDYEVACKVEDKLSKDDEKRIAIIENVQRENLLPLEEADAIVSLLQDDMKLDDIVSKTGLSESTIKRRLALANLCDEARTALSNGDITLSQAEALTVGTYEQQTEMLDFDLDYYSPDEIKEHLTDDKASLADALFDSELYTGTFSSDLFAEDESTYFNDMEQFWSLQNEALQITEMELSSKFDPVEIKRGSFQYWNYRDAEDGEKGGAVIHLQHSGKVKIHKGIVKRDFDKKVVELAEPKPKATYSKPLCEYIAMHKTLAVQVALADNPRIAKEVVIVQMLTSYDGVTLKLHACLKYFANCEIHPKALNCLEDIITPLFFCLGEIDDPFERLVNSSFLTGSQAKSIDWYEALKSFTDSELDKLHLLLTTLCFGQLWCDRLDTYENSLFNHVAKDLNVDMREYWIPDEAFLKRRTLTQLKDIIAECGLSLIFGSGHGYRKGELVESLCKQFKRIRGLKKPKEDEQKAYDWLPEVMQFPAIDPDTKAES